jgi:hypothetical protein
VDRKPGAAFYNDINWLCNRDDRSAAESNLLFGTLAGKKKAGHCGAAMVSNCKYFIFNSIIHLHIFPEWFNQY